MTLPVPGDGPRRFLIATAVSSMPRSPHGNRPALTGARRKIIDLFTRQLGYTHIDDLGMNPSKEALLDHLGQFADDPDRRPDDIVTVYLAGHGQLLGSAPRRHMFFPADADLDKPKQGLPTGQIASVLLDDTKITQLLLILDTCHAGQGGQDALAAGGESLYRSLDGDPSGIAVIAAAQPAQTATADAFPDLLTAAVESLSTAGERPAYLDLDALLAHINSNPARPATQRCEAALARLDGTIPPFFPNPRHRTPPNAVDLAIQQAAQWQEHDARRDTELHSRLLVHAMASFGQQRGWWFSGRRRALTDLTTWLHTPDPAQPARIVAAGPGSGKTAVLGLIAALSHPDRRRTVPVSSLDLPANAIPGAGVVDIALYAQALTDDDVLQGIAAAARITATTPGQLLEALSERPAGAAPFTVLIDALDEATTPDTLCSRVLAPLIAHSNGRLRLLLGTRPYLLERLPDIPVIDLDTPRYADRDAIGAYTVQGLVHGHPDSPYPHAQHLIPEVARAVADAAFPSFLVARFAAEHLATTPHLPDPHDPQWRAGLPRTADTAMANHLDRLGPHDATRARDLLRPLAYAQGQGLPWEDLWAPLATRISGRAYTDEDLLWLRHTAGSYVVEATEAGRSAYRLYHLAMAEHLQRDTDPAAVHAAFVRTLTDHVPLHPDGTRAWNRAHPYALRHLATHANDAGLLDEVLDDPEYLVHAVPESLTPHLHTAGSPPARLAAAVYRSSIGTHRHADPATRRQILALDAARYNVPTLRDALNHHAPNGTWKPLYATGTTVSPALSNMLMADHTAIVRAVACTVLDGRPIALAASGGASVGVWDLATGEPVGQPLTGHTGNVNAVACTVLDGRPIAVTGSGNDFGDAFRDGLVQVWDLATGEPVGQPLTGHTSQVNAVACSALDGRPIAVTGSADHSVRVWDLATGEPVGQPLTGRTNWVNAVACTVLDGRPIAVTGSGHILGGGSVGVWDLATGEPVGQPLTGHTNRVNAVACTVLDGRPIAVTGSDDDSVRVWDLATGEPVGQPLTGHTSSVYAVACSVLDGRPIAVIGSGDDSVRVWDLATGEPVGQPFTGHTATVYAVACSVLDGRPIAVTGSVDGSVRVWNLTTGEFVGQPRTGHTNRVNAVACSALDGYPVAITGSDGGSLQVWDLATGEPVGQPRTNHTNLVKAVACTVLDGRPVAVADSGSFRDASVRVCDLATGELLGRPLTGHSGPVLAVACGVLDGRPIAVTASTDKTVRVWDLATGEPVGHPGTGHTSHVNAVACSALDGHPIAVTGSSDHSVRVWDLATGEPVGQPLTGHTSHVNAVACSALDGHPIAVTGSNDASVRVWDLATGEAAGQPVTGHTGTVRAVACSVLDGRPIAVTGSGSGSVRVWNLEDGLVRQELRLPGAVSAVAVSEAGVLVCTFGQDIAIFQRTPLT
ncbi:caspase family protein [Streptomyces sp. QTS52]